MKHPKCKNCGHVLFQGLGDYWHMQEKKHCILSKHFCNCENPEPEKEAEMK